MPVSPAIAQANRAQTERLRRLVGRLDALCSGGYDGDLFNETAQPLLELIPPERAAAAAVRAAEEIDAFLLAVPDAAVEAALARPGAAAGGGKLGVYQPRHVRPRAVTRRRPGKSRRTTGGPTRAKAR